MATSREGARKALAALLTAQAGADKAISVVYDHLPGDFGKRNRVVCVSSAGSERRQRLGCNELDALVNVDVFVRYAVDANWTRADAEDVLDAIEAVVAGVVMDTASASWDSATYVGPTRIGQIETLGGDAYINETISVRLERLAA